MYRLAWVWILTVGLLYGGGFPEARAGLDESIIGVPVQLPLNESIDLRSPLANEQQIADNYPFFGLARYLNHVRFYRLDDQGLTRISPKASVQLNGDQWFAAVGRFQVLLIKGVDTAVHVFDGQSIQLEVAESVGSVEALTVMKSDLDAVDSKLGQLRYAHLWKPLSLSALGVDATLVFIQQLTGASWGFVLMIFALIVKVALWPLMRWVQRMQSKVLHYQSILRPQIAIIKNSYRGEEAHNRIMAAHSALGVTPFFALKPMLGILIQIPVLIAIFNALGEMHQFAGTAFLWADDLAYPDAITTMPVAIPWMGNTVNMMPCLMTAVAILGAAIHRDAGMSGDAVRRKRRQLILMGFAFFVLFYPFPAAMVFYWLMSNLLQWIEGMICHISRGRS